LVTEMRRVLIGLAALTLACTDERGSQRALEAHGFDNISLQGYAFWGCGERDSFKTRFRAKNVKGQWVTGVVCCGWMKDCTVRFD
jgi:hypothetical protein